MKTLLFNKSTAKAMLCFLFEQIKPVILSYEARFVAPKADWKVSVFLPLKNVLIQVATRGKSQPSSRVDWLQGVECISVKLSLIALICPSLVQCVWHKYLTLLLNLEMQSKIKGQKVYLICSQLNKSWLEWSWTRWLCRWHNRFSDT